MKSYSGTRIIGLTIIGLALLCWGSMLHAGSKCVAGESEIRIVGDDGEVFDIEDLKDGESRVFESGDDKVTVSRDGDRIMVKTEGEGETREFAMFIAADAPGHRIITVNSDECEVLEDCDKMIDIFMDDNEDHGGAIAYAFAEAEGKIAKLFVGSGDETIILRCPEGDTTMQIEDEDAEEIFLCPKHSVPLEKTDKGIHKFIIKTREKIEKK